MKKLWWLLPLAVLAAGGILFFGCGGGDDDDDDEVEVEVEGNWIWTVIDDKDTAKWAAGVSVINYEEGDDDPESETGEKYRVPETKTVDGEEVFHFEGTTKQKDGVNSSTYKNGAGWPLTGWMAKPADDETMALLKKAYGYSFMIKVNKDFKTYQTSVDNSYYQVDEGHEPLYWFGPDEGKDSYLENYEELEVGEWKKITVIYDPAHSGYNMDYAKWMYTHGVNEKGDYPDVKPDNWPDFDKDKVLNIKWQIQLQHNGGVEGTQTDNIDYSIKSGSHDFDVDFYGLKMLVKE